MRPEPPDPVAAVPSVRVDLKEGGEDGDPVDLPDSRLEVGVLGVAVHHVHLHRKPHERKGKQS